MKIIKDLVVSVAMEPVMKVVDKIDERDKKKKIEKYGSLESAKKAEKLKEKQNLIEYKKREKINKKRYIVMKASFESSKGSIFWGFFHPIIFIKSLFIDKDSL